MAKDRAHDPNRKLNLSRVDSAYNFIKYVEPESYTPDERVKSEEFIKNVSDKLFPDSPFKGKFTNG